MGLLMQENGDQPDQSVTRMIPRGLMRTERIETASRRYLNKFPTLEQLEEQKIQVKEDRIYVNARYNAQKLGKKMKGFFQHFEVQKIKNIKALELDFDSSKKAEFGDCGLKDFSLQTAKQLSNLQKLTLIFREYIPKGETMKLLGNTIARHLTNLKDLSIIISYKYTRMTDKEVKDMIFDITRPLLNLQGLTLLFESDSWIKETTDVAVKYISSRVTRSFPNLKRLSIRFKATKSITNKAVERLGSQIATKLTKLTHLSLAFSCYTTSDRTLKLLGSSFANKLTQLRDLSLIFHCGDSLTDNGLRALENTIIKNMTGLKRLRLGFQHIRSITDNGVEKLATALAEHQVNLEWLSLMFIGCSALTDEGVQPMGNALAGLYNLKDLSIFLWPEVTDNGLTSLVDTIAENFDRQNFSELERITLNCEGTKITEQCQKKLEREKLMLIRGEFQSLFEGQYE